MCPENGAAKCDALLESIEIIAKQCRRQFLTDKRLLRQAALDQTAQ
jgi:hypothetical protein